ncbi:expressed protein [Batrachochytrium dendrobatidis JAM81]|uniref:Expressed protein n=1 Tax=Batrachochytrium dendrobatidis (strain JAM81 / FGSC 10211) TaxID=684364 RepID=F4PDZ9_BATDJ|nr:uncharacterized protein BATDEDRAFT_36241 [Batrachochytrium dendrobatidis JAM81]EGF76466.1 expressed protein [Batrachochytrium dendrobatidis JAM81]|eukprot:XP_006682859.1 expressed protein [Batrachochytrium dendrobatidis JAM81]
MPLIRTMLRSMRQTALTTKAFRIPSTCCLDLLRGFSNVSFQQVSHMEPSSMTQLHDGIDAPSKTSSRVTKIPTTDISKAVEKVVYKYVDCSSDNWKQVQLASPSLKFRIVFDAMISTGRSVSSAELSNLFTTQDLLNLLLEEQRSSSYNPFSGRNEIEELLLDEESKSILPPNITYTNESSFKARVQPEPIFDDTLPTIVRASIV